MKWPKTEWLEPLLVGLGLVAGYAAFSPSRVVALAQADQAEAAASSRPSAPERAALPNGLAPVATPAGLAMAASLPAASSSGRPSAESPELKALREAEKQLFAPLAPGAPDPLDALGDRACGDGRGDCVASGPNWLSKLRMPDLPVRQDEEIHRYVRYFTETNRGRKIFSAWLKRSGRHRGAVAEALRDRQLPQDLDALVFVESGYSPSATSPVGAAGMWQFMSSTAKAYGLVVEPDYDERRSIKRSAEAGAHHLSDLYSRLGSWDLALAAYNMGYQGMVTRMRELGTEDFWEMSAIEGALPKETSLYVPKILSVALVLRNLDKFGFDDVPVDAALTVADIEVPSGTDFATLARAAGTSVERLREMNPEVLRSVIPGHKPMMVHVPVSGRARARAMLPELLDPLDRDNLEKRVAPTFDWGKDELPRASAGRAPDPDAKRPAKGTKK